MPGVSRNGATLAAARRRGFSREDAAVLSRHVALPVIAAASARQLVRVRRRSGHGEGARPQLVVGALSAFGSTLAAARLIHRLEADRSLLPYALYRLGLAVLILRRLGLRSAPSRTMAA
jgi:undecaprenyl-diphosphatase